VPVKRGGVEGLKIVVSGEAVVLLGKNTPPCSSIDTRLFCIPKTLFRYIEKVVAEKGRKAVLSDLVELMCLPERGLRAMLMYLGACGKI
jgi:hypothetical protein